MSLLPFTTHRLAQTACNVVDKACEAYKIIVYILKNFANNT